MANTNQLTLELLIKAVADAKGIVVTKDEINKLADSMRSAAGATGTLDTSVGAITESLQRQKTVTESAGTEWEKLTDAQKSAHREAAHVALRQIEAGEAAKKAANEAGNLGRNLGTLKQAGAGLSQVFRGLATGDLMSVGQGIGSIGKAIATASPELQKFFALAGRGAAIGANFAGPAVVGIMALTEKAKENQAAIDKIYKEQTESSENTTKMIEAQSIRRVAAHEKEMKAVQALATAYEESRARTDKAYGRDEQLDPAKKKLRDETLNAQEKKELAGARTDLERKRIKEKYELKRSGNEGRDTLNDFDRADARANIEKQKAEEAMNAANQKTREADLAVSDAQRQFDLALEGTRVFKPTDNSAAAQAARDKARAAQENLKKTKEDRDKITGETGAIIKSAQEEIDAANLVKEETDLRRRAYQKIIDGKAADASRSDPGMQKEAEEAGATAADIERRIAAEKDRASRSLKFGDKANVDGLVKELEAARKSEAEKNKAIVDDLRKRKAESDQAKRQVKNTAGGTNL